MEKEQQQEHNYKISDQEALEQLKILMEFTAPSNLRKSLQTTLFAYLKEQADRGQDANYKQVVVDFELLLGFLDELGSE